MKQPKWEYKVVMLNGPWYNLDPARYAEKLLNDLGSEGWELVIGVPDPRVTSIFAFLKRPKQGSQESEEEATQ